MSRSETNAGERELDRRKLLRGAGAVAVAGLGAAAMARPASASTSTSGRGDVVTIGPVRVRSSAQVVDAQGEQRWLLTDAKPPVHVQGRTLPAESRGGPADGSYLIFNDEDQNEKGGIIAASDGAQIALDYSNAQGATLNTRIAGNLGAAQLMLKQMPDPAIPVEDVTSADAPLRAALAVTNYDAGCLLFLADSQGRPRIMLTVDGDDVPRIQVLDAAGNVVAQMPPDASAEGKPSAALSAAKRLEPLA